MTSGPAELSSTRIYAAEALHPTEGLVHVLGYQNKVEASSGPQAMLLPIPTEAPVTSANLVNGKLFPTILADYAEAIERENQKLSRGIKSFALNADFDEDRVEVFDSGSYTVILAEKASSIPKALELVPEHRRPKVSEVLANRIGDLYPSWPVALCCFDGSMAAEPLFWWYKPMHPDQLFAPALDAHDGKVPDTTKQVLRDHTVVFSSHQAEGPLDILLQQDIDEKVPAEHRWMFHSRITGAVINRHTLNGDFVADVPNVRVARTVIDTVVPKYINLT